MEIRAIKVKKHLIHRLISNLCAHYNDVIKMICTRYCDVIMRSSAMLNHCTCIEVRHGEILAVDRYNFCFVRQNMTTEKKKLVAIV